MPLALVAAVEVVDAALQEPFEAAAEEEDLAAERFICFRSPNWPGILGCLCLFLLEAREARQGARTTLTGQEEPLREVILSCLFPPQALSSRMRGTEPAEEAEQRQEGQPAPRLGYPPIQGSAEALAELRLRLVLLLVLEIKAHREAAEAEVFPRRTQLVLAAQVLIVS